MEDPLQPGKAVDPVQHGNSTVPSRPATLAESEERLRALVTATSEIIYQMNVDWSEMITLAGKNIVDDTDAPRSDWMEAYIPLDERPRVQAAIRKAVRNGGIFELEHRVIRLDGTEGWVFSRAVAVHAEGAVRSWFGTAADITVKRQAERWQEYFLRLSDALHPLADPVEIQEAAMRVLGEHLGVIRCHYYEVEPDSGWITSAGGYTVGAFQVPGRIRMDDFGICVKDAFQKGVTLAVADVANDPHIGEDDLRSYEAIGVRAYIGVPLVKVGRFVAVLGIHSATPRAWSKDEVLVARETAERTWATLERARAESALRAEKERYRDLFESMDEGYCIIQMIYDDAGEAVDWRFIEVNPAFEKHNGMKDAVGRSMRSMVPDIEMKWVETYNRVAVTGESIRFEENSVPLERSFDLYAFRVGDPAERKVAVLFTNITERQSTDAALAASEENYRILFNSIDEGFCTIEMIYGDEGTACDYRFLQVNDAFVRQTGLENAVGRTVLDLVPGHEGYWVEIYGRVAETGESVRFEHEAAELNRYYDVYAFRIGQPDLRRVGVLFQDIAGRNRRETNQAFLVKVADRLAGLQNIKETMAILGGKIGHHFGVKYGVFAEISEDQRQVQTLQVWQSGLGSAVGGESYPLREFLSGEQVDSCLAGELTVIEDTQADSRVNGAGFRPLGIHSFILVPLLREGVCRFLVAIFDDKPRKWANEEIDLMSELTGRIWNRLERARAELALRESEAKLAAELADTQQLHRISRLIEEDDSDAIYGQIVEGACALMRSQMASIQKRSADGTELLLVAHKGFAPESVKFWERVADSGGSPCSNALVEGGVVGVPDIENSPVIAASEDLHYFRLSGIRAVLAVPLVSRRGRLVGVIAASWTRIHRASERELRILEVLARQVADLIERREATEELRRSEENYRAIFNSIEEGFALIEVQVDEEGSPCDLIVLDANPAQKRISGREIPAGTSLRSLLPTMDLAWLGNYGKVALTGEPMHFEAWFDPAGHWYEVSASRVGGEASRKVAVVYTDVTERKLREHRQEFLLRTSDELRAQRDENAVADVALQALSEELGLDRCYVTALDVEGDVARVSHQTCRPGFVPIPDGMRISDFPAPLGRLFEGTWVCRNTENDPELTPVDKETLSAFRFGAFVAATVRRGADHPCWAMIAATGDARDWKAGEVELIKEVAERAWTAMDRVRAEEALRSSEERLRITLESVEMAAWDWDIVHDRVRWNDRHFYVLGLEPDGNFRKVSEFMDFVHPDDRSGVGETLQKGARSGDFQCEFRIIRADNGEVRWMNGYGKVVESSAGRATRMTGVMYDRTERKETEEELRKAHAELEQRVNVRTQELQEALDRLHGESSSREKLEKSRHELLRRVVTSQEEERLRISRELHDNLGQHMVGVKFGLDRLQAAVEAETTGEDGIEDFNEVRGMVQSLIKAVHRQAWELRPPELEHLGLEPALRRYVEDWSRRTGIEALFENSGKEEEVAAEIAIVLYRVVQEALTNVARHSGCRRVQVCFNSDDPIRVWVRDDGRGFDPEMVTGRLGLLGMRERLSTVGGILLIHSAPGDGTRITAEVPSLR